MIDVKTILLKAKKEVYSTITGSNLSKLLGEGYDFVELQEYQPYSDIKYISWIHSAKLGEIYTKKMVEEKELNIVVCSMIDGRFMIDTKLDTLSYIVALLGYSSLYFNNNFSYIQFCAKELIQFQPTKDIKILEKSLKEIYKCELFKKKIDYKYITQKLMQSIQKKSLLFLIGDFLDEVDLSILSQKHEVIAIIVRSKWEENPKTSSDSQLINPQTGETLNYTLTKRAISYYQKKLKEHDKKLIEHFHKYQIRYTKIYNSNEAISKLNGEIGL